MPTFETAGDQINEMRIASMIANTYGVRAVKNKPFAAIDTILIDDDRQVVGFVEAKRRTSKYETLIISYEKWMAAQTLARESGKPVLIAAGFGTPDITDVYYWTCDGNPNHRLRLDIGGRYDRGVGSDVELICHLPYSEATHVT